MKKLLLFTAGITGLSFLIMALVLSQAMPPARKVKAPDPRYSAPSISSTTIREVQNFTVLISNESIDGMWRGTGILLSSTTVLTCAHVIPRDKATSTLWIYPYPGDQVVHAKLKFINYPKDLALLELTTPIVGHKNPAFAKEARLGEPILSVGNIRGYMIWFVSYGIISGEHQRWIMTDAMVRGGNSGGPWTNAKGEIVAMTDVGWEDDDSIIAGGTPVADLQRFLAEAKAKKPSIIYTLTGE